MSALEYILYDNSLEKPAADPDSGEWSKKEPFPGQERLKEGIEKQYQIEAERSTFYLKQPFKGIEKIMIRYSGSGNLSFGGLGKYLDDWNQKKLMLIVIVAPKPSEQAAEVSADTYRWCVMINEKDSTKNITPKQFSWGIPSETFNELSPEPTGLQQCVGSICEDIKGILNRLEEKV